MGTNVVALVLIVLIVSPTSTVAIFKLPSFKVPSFKWPPWKKDPNKPPKEPEEPKEPPKFCDVAPYFREIMVDKIIQKLPVSNSEKKKLKSSGVFAECVALKLCFCQHLHQKFLEYGCYGTVGTFCMKTQTNSHVFDCALNCVHFQINTNSQPLNYETLTNTCYSKCSKNTLL